MNIHLERYKQQIVESSFPLPGPRNPLSEWNPDDVQTPNATQVIERITDEIGDDTLDMLVGVVEALNQSSITSFVKELFIMAKSERAARNYDMSADEDAEDAKKIVYKVGNYYVVLTEKGFEVYSQYGYGGTFETKEEAVKELNRLLHSDTF